MLKIAPSAHFAYFVKGVKEAFNWARVIQLVTTSKVVQKTLLKSLALNGVAYLGILVVLETFYNTPDHHLFGYSYTVSLIGIEPKHYQIYFIIAPKLISLMDLTGYPLYLICLVFNSKFYLKIAQHDRQFQQQQDYNVDIVTTINTIILYSNFALFIAFVRWIPFIGSIISFFIYCIIMSYYCFEYKWINQDWTIEQRMIYAEQHWAYCLGFGLPATIIIYFFSTLKANGVFALIYPSFIIMASVAMPEPINAPQFTTSSSPARYGLPYRIPVLFGIRYMNQFIIQTIRTLGGSRGETFILEKKKDNLGKLV